MITLNLQIKIKACNCLSEIVSYDLKTLVTVPPGDTQKTVDIAPKNYIACVVLKSLAQVMFDDDPVVTGKVAETLNSLLKCREGNDALGNLQNKINLFKVLFSHKSIND